MSALPKVRRVTTGVTNSAETGRTGTFSFIVVHCSVSALHVVSLTVSKKCSGRRHYETEHSHHLGDLPGTEKKPSPRVPKQKIPLAGQSIFTKAKNHL